MGSRENSNRVTNLFQSHYYINVNFESKCVMERWIRNKTKVFAILNRGKDYIMINY